MDQLDTLIKLALDEDIGPGDITSKATVDDSAHATARIMAKGNLVVCGIDVARRVFERVDKKIEWTANSRDGSRCKAGDLLATLKGKTTSLLSGERTALNFLQHLSGIATLTRKFVDAAAGSGIKILDTRKTTPGLRALEKHAVKIGGGMNHRMGLFDHFLIKNNHIAAAGSIAKALDRAHRSRQPGQRIEIETKNLNEVEEAARGNADIIMLDNMDPDQVRMAVRIIDGRAKIEVSGNMTIEAIKSYADTGVDFISVGALTHSAPASDIHMLIV